MLDFGNTDSWMWHGPTLEVRFQILQDGKPILCRVTRECISDHCGNPTDDEAILTAAKQFSEPIENQLAHYITIERFEPPDGSILLRSADWR